MNLYINGKRYAVTLVDNPTTKALIGKLPLDLTMEELNGNEKFVYLASNLPAQEASVGQIEAGDIMLYGKNCLVIFYAPLKTSYRYTRLGKIDHPVGLADALGSGAVKVRWEP